MVPVGLVLTLKELQEAKALPACIMSLIGQLIIACDPGEVIRGSVGCYDGQTKCFKNPRRDTSKRKYCQ